jgi:hypothetical protein
MWEGVCLSRGGVRVSRPSTLSHKVQHVGDTRCRPTVAFYDVSHLCKTMSLDSNPFSNNPFFRS